MCMYTSSDLQRRGCVRTAFEFARLLYALDPWTDPHGALLHLEFLAIKSGMEEWMLDETVGSYRAALMTRKEVGTLTNDTPESSMT